MATHSSVLAWRIPGMGEPGGLPSVGSHRGGHDRSDLAAAAADKYKSHTSVSSFSVFTVKSPSDLLYHQKVETSVSLFLTCLLVCLSMFDGAARRLSLVVAGGASLCCRSWASHCGGFSSCRAQALELSCCGRGAQLLHGTWDLPGSVSNQSPALAGGLLITGPPGKSLLVSFTDLVGFQHYLLCKSL